MVVALVLPVVVVVRVVMDGGSRREAGGRFSASGIAMAGPDQGYIFYVTKPPL
jgi:hypothetical protein